MNQILMDLSGALTEVRKQGVAMAEGGWSELGALVGSTLPDPLDPMALLPIATGRAVGGTANELIPVAAAVILVDLSLRIIDDCADMDNPNALYRSIGVGRAMNYAMALNSIAARALSQSNLPPDRLDSLMTNYYRSFLLVCQGQDADISKQVGALAEYKEQVELKAVAAYEFAAVVGAHIALADAKSFALCAKCGIHLGWMAQILDDIEALWFPVLDNSRELEKLTFPILWGLTMDHPNARLLESLCGAKEYDRTRICALLDEMDVRAHLMSLALEHRDQAIEALDGAPDPEGSAILRTWLDWLLRDGASLLEINKPC